MHVCCARHVAAAYARAWFGFAAGKAAGTAGIGDLGIAAADDGHDILEVAHDGGTKNGVECLGHGFGGAVFHGAGLALPFGKAAIQHFHIVMAQGLEHPPHARGRKNARAVIDHQALAVADAQRAYGAGKVFGAREHVRQIGGTVSYRVDVEMHRARNVRDFKFSPGVAVFAGHVPGGVHHPHIIQMRRQPFGGHQIGHCPRLIKREPRWRRCGLPARTARAGPSRAGKPD